MIWYNFPTNVLIKSCFGGNLVCITENHSCKYKYIMEENEYMIKV